MCLYSNGVLEYLYSYRASVCLISAEHQCVIFLWNIRLFIFLWSVSVPIFSGASVCYIRMEYPCFILMEYQCVYSLMEHQSVSILMEH